jgi:hypothetical protein
MMPDTSSAARFDAKGFDARHCRHPGVDDRLEFDWLRHQQFGGLFSFACDAED